MIVLNSVINYRNLSGLWGQIKKTPSIYLNNTKDVNSYVCRNSAFISSMKIHVYVCANLVSIAVLDICTVEPKVVIFKIQTQSFQ